MPSDHAVLKPSIWHLVVALIALTMPFTHPGRSAADDLPPLPQTRPNVLIIVTDDQRVDAMDVMPQTRRYFEEQGITFSNAFATTPLCCPSRATIMTGRYAHNHELRRNGEANELDQKTTIQARLRSAGYLTAMAGKYLNGWNPRIDPPHFDRWALLVPPDDSRTFLSHDTDGYYDTYFNVDGRLARIRPYSTNFLGDRGVGWLRDFETEDDRPWFFYLAPYGPHEPYTPEPKYADAAVPRWNGSPAVGEKDVSDKPRWIRESTGDRRAGLKIRRKQLRNLMSVDDLVGRVLTELQSLGESENTLVFFLSDNGYMWGEHRVVKKQFPYTESVQIPLFVRWPARLTSASVDDRLAATVDIAPTIFEAAGLSSPLGPAVDGKSLLGGGSRDGLLMEYWLKEAGDAPPTWASLRTASYHYIEYYGVGGNVRFREYYDLVADPSQSINLLHDRDAGNDPDVEALSRQLRLLRDCSGATCP